MEKCDLPDKQQLRDYFLNRLTPDEAAHMQYHLLHCQACRQELEQMRLLAYDLGLKEKEADSEFVDPPRRYPLHFLLRVVAMIAVVVLVALGSYYFTTWYMPGIPVDTNLPPIYQSGDSIRQKEVDSIRKEKRRKEIERLLHGDPWNENRHRPR